MILEKNGYSYDDTDLNSMLQYCAYLRGTLNTMHHTLREFEVFLDTIFNYSEAHYRYRIEDIRKDADVLGADLTGACMESENQNRQIAIDYAHLIENDHSADALLTYAGIILMRCNGVRNNENTPN